MLNFIKLYFVSIFLFKFVTFSFADENSQIVNPCPNIFQYVNDGQKTYGQIKISNPDLSTIKMVAKLSVPVKLLSPYIGEIKPFHHDLNVARSEAQRSGFLTYNILFPVSEPLPLVTSITVNGNEVCSGSPATGSYVTTIILSHNILFNIQFLPSQNVDIQNIPAQTSANVIPSSSLRMLPGLVRPCGSDVSTIKKKMYVVVEGQKLRFKELSDQDLATISSPVYLVEEELKFTPINGVGCK